MTLRPESKKAERKRAQAKAAKAKKFTRYAVIVQTSANIIPKISFFSTLEAAKKFKKNEEEVGHTCTLGGDYGAAASNREYKRMMHKKALTPISPNSENYVRREMTKEEEKAAYTEYQKLSRKIDTKIAKTHMDRPQLTLGWKKNKAAENQMKKIMQKRIRMGGTGGNPYTAKATIKMMNQYVGTHDFSDEKWAHIAAHMTNENLHREAQYIEAVVLSGVTEREYTKQEFAKVRIHGWRNES